MKYVQVVLLFTIVCLMTSSFASETEEEEGPVLKKLCSQSLKSEVESPQVTPPRTPCPLWGNNQPITLLRPDHLKVILSYILPLGRARLREVSRAFKYCVDCLEYSGKLSGEIRAESLRKMFRVQVSFEFGDWHTPLTPTFLPLIEYVTPSLFEDEQYIPFSQVVPKSDEIVSLCEGRKCFEVMPGAHFAFSFIGLYRREGFYTCKHSENIGQIKRNVHFAFPVESIDQEIDTVHLVFTTNQKEISCDTIVTTKGRRKL